MAVSLAQFIKHLENSGVLASDTLKEFLPPQRHPKDAEDLVRELLRQKKLTKFQADELCIGNGNSLVLGNYVLLEKIGAGGMGQVFKAEHRRMKRLVALKMLPQNVTRDKSAIARFEREIEVAAKINHPNIVSAFDADQSNGVHFLVMELVDGIDLSALVKRDGPLPVGKVASYILQAARGLEAAHAKGIVHRDIKPSNLFLDEKGTVKILDMGLARLNSDEQAPFQADLTTSRTVMGTFDFMSPEQAINSKYADTLSDQYSLGISLFFLVTGKPAYGGDTPMEKLLAHRESPLPSLLDVSYVGGADVPYSGLLEKLNAVFHKMIAKRPIDRYASMTDVIAALTAVESAILDQPIAGLIQMSTVREISDSLYDQLTRSLPVKPPTNALPTDGTAIATSDSVSTSGPRAADELPVSCSATTKNERAPIEPPKTKSLTPLFPRWTLGLGVILVVSLSLLIVAGDWKSSTDQERNSTVQTHNSTDQVVKSSLTKVREVRSWTVSQAVGEAEFRSLAAALDRAQSGDTIRVLDDATYSESLILNNPKRWQSLTVESPRGAILTAPEGNFAVVTIKKTSGVVLRGFRIEGKARQHSIAVLGAGGVLLEDLVCEQPVDSTWANVLLAEGTGEGLEQPTRIRNTTFRSGQNGVLIDGNGKAVKSVLLEGNRFFRGENHVVVCAGAEHISIENNIFCIGTPLFVDLSDPTRSRDLRFSNNTCWQTRFWMTVVGPQVPEGVEVSNNVILGADELHVKNLELTDLARRWSFHNNWWEPNASTNRVAAQSVAELKPEIPLLSRTPQDADFLRPPADSPLGTGGTNGDVSTYLGALPPASK